MSRGAPAQAASRSISYQWQPINPIPCPLVQRLDRNDVEHHKEVTVIFLADASG